MAMRILYVDDEDDLRMLVQCQLSLEGYSVEVARDGHSALEQLERFSFDVVLLDLHMPGMDGAEVTRELRRRDLHPPIILLTGDSPAEAAGQCKALGAAGFLSKPFHFSDLAAAIGRALAPVGTGSNATANP